MIVHVERHGADDNKDDEKERHDDRGGAGGARPALGPVPPHLAVLALVVVRTVAVWPAVARAETAVLTPTHQRFSLENMDDKIKQ